MAKTNQEEQRKAPILRFKGFTNDWEQVELKDLFKIVSEKGFPYLPVLMATQDKGMIYRDKSKIDIKFNERNLNNYKLVEPEQFVVHLRSFQGGIASSTLKGIASPAYTVLKFKNTNQCFEFWREFYKNKKFINSLVKVTYGIRDGRSINVRDLLDLKYFIPTQIQEEQKISHIINFTNKLITLYERKNKLLSQMKKYFLDNLFAENKYPNLRFKGFTNAWEQKKLGNYIIQYKEKTIINNQYPVLTSSRNGIFLQKDYYNGRNVASKNNIGYSIVPRNYFTYRNMSDDLKFKFNINTIVDKGIVSPIYPVFTTKNNLNSIFLKYKLNYGKEFKKFAIIQKQGGTRTSLNYSKLEEFYINMPCYCEQKIIAKTINLS